MGGLAHLPPGLSQSSACQVERGCQHWVLYPALNLTPSQPEQWAQQSQSFGEEWQLRVVKRLARACQDRLSPWSQQSSSVVM